MPLFHLHHGHTLFAREHYLLLDLVDCQVYTGTAREVERFLRDYGPRPDPAPEQAEMMVQALQERSFKVDPDAIERDMQFRSLAVNALVKN